MEHDLKRYPRLLAKLLTGQPLPLGCSVQGCISVWNLAHLGVLTSLEQEKLGWMVDVIARSSAQAQGLRGPITTLQKLQRTGQTLYLAAERTVADRVRLVGLLKTGHKNFFLRGAGSAYSSQQPLCVLDFFVLPQHQRQGIGQALFKVFQATEQESPGSVAYDTPSPKLLSFLQKHYEECCIKGADAATQQIRVGALCSAPSNRRTLAIQLWWTVVFCRPAAALSAVQEDMLLLRSSMQLSRYRAGLEYVVA